MLRAGARVGAEDGAVVTLPAAVHGDHRDMRAASSGQPWSVPVRGFQAEGHPQALLQSVARPQASHCALACVPTM